MPHYGTLRAGGDYSTTEADDIRGASVYGMNDDKLGKIDDVIFDHASGHIVYVVIDTGGWLTTKKFVVPANQLNESAKHDHDYVVELTKKQIEKFPPYDEGDVASEESWELYEGRYRNAWSDGAILHREGSNRTVTPASDEVQAGHLPASTLSEEDQTADLEAAGPADDRVFPATGNTVSPNPNSGAVGSRYLAFEGELQSRRKEITSSCTTCSKSPESESYDTDRRRTGT
jgi:sporulation protein YlmC with PRC-barrel domain